jgi:hypothetical protein
MYACENGDVAVIERVLAFVPHSVSTADPQEATALHYLLRNKPAPANKVALSRAITLLARHGADVAAVEINSSLPHFQTYMQMFPETVLLLISLGAQYRYCHDDQTTFASSSVFTMSKGPRARSQVRFRGKQCELFAREAMAFASIPHQGQGLLADTDQEVSLVSLAVSVSEVVLGKLDSSSESRKKKKKQKEKQNQTDEKEDEPDKTDEDNEDMSATGGGVAQTTTETPTPDPPAASSVSSVSSSSLSKKERKALKQQEMVDLDALLEEFKEK